MPQIHKMLALTTLLLAGAPSLAQTATPTAALQTAQGVRQTILDNGLTVLTKEVRSAPVVSVQVFYKIGSRNEAPGVNGIAHQLEHMLFKGTTDRPVQFGRLLSALGADSNAFTFYDQTGYYATVEREKAGALLALEADRMVNARIDPEQLASERNVVLSELEGYENSPSYRLSRAVRLAAFPNSPYGLSVGGTRKDVEGFTADKVRAYYQKYYSPEYATLVVVGDFNTDQLLAQIRADFGKLGKPGTRPVKVSEPLVPRASGATLGNTPPKAPIVLREPGATALLNAVYPLPGGTDPDAPALDLLSSVLLSDANSRLYQALFETGLIADGNTSSNTLLSGGWFDFSFTPAPGKTPQEVDKAVLAALKAVRDQPVTAEELARAKTKITASTILGNVSVTDQADRLGFDATSAGDYQYTDKYLAALQKVTAADLQRVARKYLQDASRTVGYFEPTAPKPGEAAASTGATSEKFNAGPPVDPAEVAKYLPPYQPSGQAQVPLPEQVKLPNGLTLLLLRDTSSPTVSLAANVFAGLEFDTDPKAGLADLVAGNLLSGTKTRDEQALAKLLGDVGAGLSPRVNRSGVAIDGASLKGDLPVLAEALSDILQNATFPEDKFKLSQASAIQGVRRSDDDPRSVAQQVFRKTVYPKGNPWQVFSTQQTLAGLTQPDLAAFYKAHYRPDTTVITLVGDFDPAQVKTLMEQKFGGWKVEGPAPTLSYPVIPKPKGIVRANPQLPGKTQAVTYIGYQGIDRRNPRYYASLVLNAVLGGDTLSSRLGAELRDKLGLTYGVNSSFAAGKQAGPFAITLQTNPKDTERAVQAALALVGQVRDSGISETELNTAKNSLVSSYTVGLSDPAALAGTFTSFYSLGLPLTELTQYQAKVNAVTLAQVNAAAKELLDPQNVVVVTAGPNAK